MPVEQWVANAESAESRRRYALVVLILLATLTWTCSAGQRLVPRELFGHYVFNVPLAAIEGGIRVASDPSPAAHDTLWVAGAVIDCQRAVAGCSIACGTFCLRIHEGAIHGTFTPCQERRVPETRPRYNPRTGRNENITTVVTRTVCEEALPMQIYRHPSGPGGLHR